MVLTKKVDGVTVELSPKEEATVRAGWTAKEAEQAEWERLHGHKEPREREYPSFGDFIDAIFRHLYEGDSTELEAIRDKRQEIKAKYPKG